MNTICFKDSLWLKPRFGFNDDFADSEFLIFPRRQNLRDDESAVGNFFRQCEFQRYRSKQIYSLSDFYCSFFGPITASVWQRRSWCTCGWGSFIGGGEKKEMIVEIPLYTWSLFQRLKPPMLPATKLGRYRAACQKVFPLQNGPFRSFFRSWKLNCFARGPTHD